MAPPATEPEQGPQIQAEASRPRRRANSRQGARLTGLCWPRESNGAGRRIPVRASAYSAWVAEPAMAQRLINEHEMGELFKVLALTRGLPGIGLLGFAQGDRSHRL